MKKDITLLTAIILLVGIFMCLIDSYVLFNIAYIAIFVLILAKIILSISELSGKIISIVIFALIMIAQILFNTLAAYNDYSAYNILKVSKIIIFILPFIVCVWVYYPQNYIRSFNEFTDISYLQFVESYSKIKLLMNEMAKKKKALSKENIKIIFDDLHRHNCFKYINHQTLTSLYFEKAYKTLDNGYVYIALTNSKSISSGIIGVFTNREYNHISIAFDEMLDTIVSYNGGERILPPGLNPEILMNMYRNSGASVIIYKLAANKEQKKKIIDEIYKINETGSAYNVIGLVFKKSLKPNIMFCSQFVYTMLDLAELSYFSEYPCKVKPTDFIEKDYQRKLEYVCEISADGIDYEKKNL